MTELVTPLLLKNGKIKAFAQSDGFLLGGLNFSYKRITGNITLTIPIHQQMLVMEDLQIDAGSDIIVGSDSDVFILGGV